MATGYTRQSAGQIVDGNVATASMFNNEFNKLQEAFNVTTGHTHDGTAGGGARLTPGGLAGLTSAGFAARISDSAFAPRTMTGTANQITVTNGDGVSANPIFSLPDAMTFTGKTVTGGTFNGGTIGSGTTISKSPVITFGGDFAGSATMTNLGDVTISGSLAGMAANGIAVRTGAGSYAPRTIVSPSNGLSITNGNGVGGNPTITLSNDLAGLEGISGTGFAARTAADTWVPRTIEGTDDQIIVDNGNGVTDNPAVRLATNITFPGSIKTTTGGADITGNSVFRSDVTFSGLLASRGLLDSATSRVTTLTNVGLGVFSTTPVNAVTIGSSTFTNDSAIFMQSGNGSNQRAWRMGVRYGGTNVTGANYGFFISDVTGGGDRFWINFTDGRVNIPLGAVVSKTGNNTGDVLTIASPGNVSDSGCQIAFSGQNANAFMRVVQTPGATQGAIQFVNTGYTLVTADFRPNGSAFNVTGTWGSISDVRVKEHISDARDYLADLNKLRVVKYALKQDQVAEANKLGFIAQEVAEVFPALIEEGADMDGNELLSIKSTVLIPMLVKAVQELTAKCNSLEDRIIAMQVIQ